MQLQPEFFHHITGPGAGDAAPLMARIALNILRDPLAHPLSLNSIKDVGRFARDPSTCGLNEFFIAEFLRAAIMDDLEPWEDAEAAVLAVIAARPDPQMII